MGSAADKDSSIRPKKWYFVSSVHSTVFQCCIVQFSCYFGYCRRFLLCIGVFTATQPCRPADARWLFTVDIDTFLFRVLFNSRVISGAVGRRLRFVVVTILCIDIQLRGAAVPLSTSAPCFYCRLIIKSQSYSKSNRQKCK